MATQKQKPKPANRPVRGPNRKSATAKRTGKGPARKQPSAEPPPKPVPDVHLQPAGKASSKQEAVLGLLRRPTGTTIEAVSDATGWKSHSVRGFFAGVVKKKLKLELVSEKADGKRVYRIDQSGKTA